MKILFSAVVFIVAIMSLSGNQLFLNGSSDYVIVVDPSATVAERYAAAELQKYIRLCSGIELPITANSNGKAALRVGRGSEIKALLPDINFEKLAADEVIIKTKGSDLIISGGRPRGTIYAVDIFLEQYLGIRWWTSKAIYIPSLAEYNIPDLDYRYKPPFISRDVYYKDAIENPEFATKMKLNGHMQPIPDKLGGNIKLLGWCHTFEKLIPPAKYFADHPEWFSLVGGKRIPNGQLCLTNRKMESELIKNARMMLDDNPGQRLISISQNDNGMACTCRDCQKVIGKSGNQSDILLDFINRVAGALEQSHPGVIVETLAYQYTQAAPKTVKARPNVLVRLCALNANEAYPLNSKQNQSFANQLSAWSKITSQLAVWNYTTNFANFLSPHPNWRYIAEDLRTMAQFNTIMVFQQGDAFSEQIGDLNELRCWLNGKLLWDPSLDQDKLIDEFLAGYYGDASTYVRRYIDLTTEELYKKTAPMLSCYMQDTGGWLSIEGLLKLRQIIDQAQRAVANDAVLAERIRRIAILLDFTLLNRFEVTRYNKDQSIRTQLDAIDMNKLMDSVFAEAPKYKVYKYAEGKTLVEFEKLLRNRVGLPEKTETPAVCREVPYEDWQVIPIENAITFGNLGVDDSFANGGKAVRMRNNLHDWLVQLTIPYFPDNRKRDFYLRCKVTGNPIKRNAFLCGLYDNAEKEGKFTYSAKSDDVFGDQYRYIKIGTSVPSGNSYVFIAPIVNKEEQFIWIDELVLVAR